MIATRVPSTVYGRKGSLYQLFHRIINNHFHNNIETKNMKRTFLKKKVKLFYEKHSCVHVAKRSDRIIVVFKDHWIRFTRSNELEQP